MAPTRIVSFYQGDAAPIPFPQDGLPPTAGWSVTFTLFSPTGTALLTLTPAADTPTQGVLTVTLAHAQTAALAPGSYPFELHRTDAGHEAMLALGSASVLAARLP